MWKWIVGAIAGLIAVMYVIFKSSMRWPFTVADAAGRVWNDWAIGYVYSDPGQNLFAQWGLLIQLWPGRWGLKYAVNDIEGVRAVELIFGPLHTFAQFRITLGTPSKPFWVPSFLWPF